MHELKRKIKEELYKLEDEAKRNPNVRMPDGEVQKIHMLTDTLKNFCKIEKLEQEMEGGRSERGYSRESYDRGNSYGHGGEWEAHGSYDGRGGSSYGTGDSYDGGMSERRRRDSMGRYSRDEGYEDMTRKLTNMVKSARNDEERDTIKRALEMLEQQK